MTSSRFERFLAALCLIGGLWFLAHVAEGLIRRHFPDPPTPRKEPYPMDVQHLPLDTLRPSADNARQQKPNQADVEALAASIDAHTLLHPLAVVAVEGGAEVLDGEHRRLALELLRDQNKIPADHPVPVEIQPPVGGPDRADGVTLSEISLAANTCRVAMHPMDQVESFTAIHDAGSTVEAIASRFGCTATMVEQRLRLAGVAPVIRKAYRNGELDMRTLEAFTLTLDRKQQVETWKRVKVHAYSVTPYQVRRMLTEDKIEGDHRLVRYVGARAYEAAGGTITRDLFGDSDNPEEKGTFIDDMHLLRTLAHKKLERAAGRISKEGWRWVSIQPEAEWNDLNKFERFQPADDETFTEEEKAVAGCILTVGGHNRALVKRGLIRTEDRGEARALVKKALKAASQAQPHGDGDGDGGDAQPAAAATKIKPKGTAERRDPDPESQARKEAGLSASLDADLAVIRGNLIRCSLAARPDVADDLLTFQLARRTLGEANPWRQKGALDLAATAQDLRPYASEPFTDPETSDAAAADNPGGSRFQAASDELSETHAGWLSTDPGENTLLQWRTFQALDAETKDKIRAHCIAATVRPQLSFHPTASIELEAVVAQINPAFHTAARSAEVLWDRLPKATLLASLEEVGGPDLLERYKDEKKADLAAQVGALFLNPDKADVPEATRLKIRQWAPPGFRSETARLPAGKA